MTTANISCQPDSRYADWHLAELAAEGDTATLVRYLREAEYGAFDAQTTDHEAWETAWAAVTDLLVTSRHRGRKV